MITKNRAFFIVSGIMWVIVGVQVASGGISLIMNGGKK